MCWFALLLFSAVHAADVKWNGALSSETFTYFDTAPEPTRTVDSVLWLKPDFDIKWNKRSRFIIRPLLRVNTSTQESPEQIFLNAAETHWDIKWDSLRITLGSNVHNWGNLDGYSPLDLVNGKTLFNPLSSDRRGAPMVDVSYSGESVKLQALYIPKQARTLLPASDSRWLPREFFVNTTAAEETVLLPPSFNYFYPGYIELDSALKNNFGLRISTTLETLDAHLIYFNGMSNNTQISPTFQADVVAVSPLILQARSDIGIFPVYYRTETIGTSLVWAPTDIIFKLESAYSRTLEKQAALPDWSWQTGGAIEVPFTIGNFSTTTVVQYYYGENRDPAENLVSSNSRLFDRAALIGQRVEWSASLDSFLSVLWDYENEGHMILAKLNYSFNDNWKTSGQVDMLDGKDTSLLGTYKKNDRFIFSLTYLW